MNFSQKSLISLIGKFSTAVIALLTSVLLARFLGVEGVGRYQLFISTQSVIITILAMGFGNATIFFINSKKIDQKMLVSNLFKVFRFISLFLSVVLCFSIFIFSNYFGEVKPLGIIFFSIGSGALLFYNVLMPVLYAKLEIIKLQILSLCSSLILAIGILTVNFTLGCNLDNVLVIIGIGNLVSTSLLFYYLRMDIAITIKMDYPLIKSVFLYGIKISATNFVFILSSNMVIFLMNNLLDNGFEALGLFSRATAITNMFLIFPTTLGPLFYSKWSGIKKQNLTAEIEKVLRLTFTFSLVCTTFTILFGKMILVFLYGAVFIKAQSALSILSVSIIFSSITIVLTNFFSSIGKPVIILKVFSGSLIVSFILSVLLIPKFGIEGAAISVLLGLIYNVVILAYRSSKECNLSLLKSLIVTKTDLKQLKRAIKIK